MYVYSAGICGKKYISKMYLNTYFQFMSYKSDLIFQQDSDLKNTLKVQFSPDFQLNQVITFPHSKTHRLNYYLCYLNKIFQTYFIVTFIADRSIAILSKRFTIPCIIS